MEQFPKIMCNLYTAGLQLYWNKLHLKRFLEKFENFSNQLFFLKIVIFVEELNFMKDYMKAKFAKIACKFAVKSD